METLPLPDEISEFWVDDARLYWATPDRRVRSCLHDDCEHTTLTYGSAYSLIVNDPNVFWADAAGALVTCLKAGCSGTPSLLVNDPYMKGAIGDGDYVYWSSAFDAFRCPSSGCGDDTPQVVVRSESTPDLHFAGSRAYWSRFGGLADGGNASFIEIRSAPKDGSEPPTTVFTITADFADFAVDTTNLYWIDDSFQVQSCPLDRCRSQPPTALVTSDHEKDHLKVDASGLYWYERSENPGFVIGFCPLSGCGSEPRALTDAVVGSGPTSPYALDSRYVYWQELAASGALDTKSIRRTRKPTP